jgi:hypothetical protein
MEHEHRRQQEQRIEYHPIYRYQVSLCFLSSNSIFSHTTVILAASKAVSIGLRTRAIKSSQMLSNSALDTFNLKSRPS